LVEITGMGSFLSLNEACPSIPGQANAIPSRLASSTRPAERPGGIFYLVPPIWFSIRDQHAKG
jgi:hypothetical protein